MIKIVDYGLGNIRAFVNVFKRLGVQVELANSSEQLLEAEKLILPGVGAFDHAMDLLNGSGMRETLDKRVLEDKVPVMGICVGMQILAASSDEGKATGLNWIPGRVRSLRTISNEDIVLPHMGWNDIEPRETNGLFTGLEKSRFYFLHSYYYECDRSDHVAAVANYGTDFTCSVRAGNVYGVQFHPEKSHHFGKQLLKNFADL